MFLVTMRVCVCVFPASQEEEGSASIETDIWAITICVWVCEGRKKKDSGRWLLMNTQWQDECSDLQRCFRIVLWLNYVYHRESAKKENAIISKPLIINQIIKTESGNSHVETKKGLQGFLQVQTGLPGKSAAPSRHLFMWRPAASHFLAIFRKQLVTAGLVFSQDATVKANGNKLKPLGPSAVASVVRREVIE